MLSELLLFLPKLLFMDILKSYLLPFMKAYLAYLCNERRRWSDVLKISFQTFALSDSCQRFLWLKVSTEVLIKILDKILKKIISIAVLQKAVFLFCSVCTSLLNWLFCCHKHASFFNKRKTLFGELWKKKKNFSG